MTQPNLYSPPKAATADVAPDPTTPKPRRPISAWLLMGLVAFMLLAALAGAWRTAWAMALEWRQLVSPLNMALGLAWKLAIVVLAILAIRAIYRGRPWARWAGLAVIVAFGVFMAVRTDTTVYANDAERAGGELARVLLPILCIGWGWAFSLTAKARRYFASSALDGAGAA